MTRKAGDFNYRSFYNFESFIEDGPIHKINDTNWFLKKQNNLPSFFLKQDNVFKQMNPECFFITAEKSASLNMQGWQDQCKQFFKINVEKIKCLYKKK